MDISRIFDEVYCNELLDASDSKKEAKRLIQLAQMFTALKRVISFDHLSYCINKINVFKEVEEIPFFHGDSHEEILSELNDSIMYHEQKLTILFFFLYENMDLESSQVNTLTKTVKTAIRTFLEERDELCTCALHKVEFLVESNRLEKILYYAIV